MCQRMSRIPARHSARLERSVLIVSPIGMSVLPGKDGGLLLDRSLLELNTPRACHPERNRGPRQARWWLVGVEAGVPGDGRFCRCWGGVAKYLLFLSRPVGCARLLLWNKFAPG
jgi:hypothetical protein